MTASNAVAAVGQMREDGELNDNHSTKEPGTQDGTDAKSTSMCARSTSTLIIPYCKHSFHVQKYGAFQFTGGGRM